MSFPSRTHAFAVLSLLSGAPAVHAAPPLAKGEFNAAQPAYDARVTVEAGPDVFKNPKSSVKELIDGNPSTRFVVTGSPYTVEITLPFPVAVERLSITQSKFEQELAPKDLEISFDDEPPVAHTLQLLRPARKVNSWQDIPVGRTVRSVKITVRSLHPGTQNWGGFGDIALITREPMDDKFRLPDYDANAPVFVEKPASGFRHDPAKTTLPPRVEPGEYPRLLFTPAEFAAFKHELPKSERGQAALKAFLDLAKARKDDAIDFPSVEDTVANRASKTHSSLSNRAQSLAFAALLTGDASFARPAREILLGYAERYEGYPRHSGRNAQDSAKISFQRLSEAMWLIPLLVGHDYLLAGGHLSAEDKQKIEAGLIRPAILEIRRDDAAGEIERRARKNPEWRTAIPEPAAQGHYPNWTNFYSTATIMAGSLMDDRDLIDLAAADLRAGIATGIGDDGMWGEGAIGYQLFVMGAMAPGMDVAARQGIDLWNLLDGRFKRLFDSPLRYAYPDGTLPGINDSGRARLGTWQSMVYDYGYQRYGDPAYAFVVNASPRQLHTSEGVYSPTRFYEPLPEPSTLPGGSVLFDSLGYAVVRNPRTYALLKYGPHGGVHGHYDRLNLVLFGEGAEGARDELAGEPKFHFYDNPLHPQWTIQTVAHNTLTVDERCQAAGEGRLVIFKDTPRLKVMRADSVSAYPGVLLDRTVIVADDAIIDLFHGSALRPHTWDRTLRFTGPLESLGPLPDPAKPLGTTDGYQHLNVVGRQTSATGWTGVWTTKAGAVRTVAPALADLEVIRAHGPDGNQLALLRRTGATADFPLVYALDAWNNPVVASTWTPGEQVGVLEFTQKDGAATTVVVAHKTGSWKAAGWSSDACMLHVKRKGTDTRVFVGGGTFAENGRLSLRAPAAGNHLARQVGDALQLETP